LVSATRYYHIYFDTTDAFSAPTLPADRVQVQPNQEYRGQSSFVIETLDSDNTTVNATYYYHKLGGGFASIKDRQDKDWISYQQGSGTKSGGEYRGIPNLGKVFHPGYSNNSGNNQGSNSTITDDGSLKVTIRSVSKDGEWEVEWGIYPTYIQMTVIDHPNDEKYWMLYEGTPGGQLDYSSNPRDTMMMSDGSEINVNQTHNADFDPDWVYFADGTIDRSIFVAHSPNDNIIDSYRHQDDFSGNGDADAMTVFGFGRNRLTGTTKYLEADGATLTVGFIDDRDYSDNKPVINAAYRALTITIGNEVPTLDANSGFTVDEGETAVFTSTNLDASDPEGGEITYEIGSAPANGTLFRNDTPLSDSDTFTQTDINGGIISYDHDGSETSSDSFTFTITDDLTTSAVKSFAIGITAVNDPPTATSDNEQLTAGGSTTINLVANDDDVDDSTLFVTSLTQPTHGMVVNNGNGTVTYSIGFDYEGNDTFTYRATDGELSSATTTVTITVDPALNIYIPLVIK
ncbi:MAG: hypothetical protein GY943_38280, partial [Chloroflexi bacterium]|nr:hypothetical protein [Chloroflexota bacterium]